MEVLVTGAAGFIGSALTHALLDRGDEVVGIDNLNDYHDVRLKQARLDRFRPRKGFVSQKLDIVECKPMAGNVKFLGFRDEVPPPLRDGCFFVLPSLSEELPLSITEAMAPQKLVVAPRRYWRIRQGGTPQS